MDVWRSIDEVPTELRASVVTIGNFDGVHQGHRHVLATAGRLAADHDPPVPVVAVTFDPHPLYVLAPAKAPTQLTSLRARLRLLEEAGADAVLVLEFDRELASWSPDEFISRVLVDCLHSRAVVVGENFRFGSKAAGDVAYLRERGADLGYTVEGLALDGERQPWSSTYVRGLVAEGDVRGAAHALGRFHSVDGVVVEGDKRGRGMGFPTANVPASGLVAIPADGVYAGWLRRLGSDGAAMPAAISVGSNPTFDGLDRRVESYVLDRTDLDLYGEHVEVTFVDRVRGQVRFTGMDDLIEQMHRDVESVRQTLDGLDPVAAPV